MRSGQGIVLLVGGGLLGVALLLTCWMVATGSPSATPRGSLAALPLSTRPIDPVRTAAASAGPVASMAAGLTETYVVDGNDFVSSSVPEHASVTPGDAGAELVTTRESAEPLLVTYKLSAAVLPAGAVMLSVDVRICGRGEGDFWEVYGPLGADPFEYEVTAPEADGCWHFTDATGEDLSVIAATMFDTRMVIEKVEYTITFAA